MDRSLPVFGSMRVSIRPMRTSSWSKRRSWPSSLASIPSSCASTPSKRRSIRRLNASVASRKEKIAEKPSSIVTAIVARHFAAIARPPTQIVGLVCPFDRPQDRTRTHGSEKKISTSNIHFCTRWPMCTRRSKPIRLLWVNGRIVGTTTSRGRRGHCLRVAQRSASHVIRKATRHRHARTAFSRSRTRPATGDHKASQKRTLFSTAAWCQIT